MRARRAGGRAGFQVPPRPRPPGRPPGWPALTVVATGCRPEPRHCSATSGHLLEEQGVRGQATPRPPGPQPHSPSLTAQPSPQRRHAAAKGPEVGVAPPAPRDAAWKTGSRHLDCGFDRGPRHLGSAYGSAGRLRAGGIVPRKRPASPEAVGRPVAGSFAAFPTPFVGSLQALEIWDNSEE